MDKHTQDKILEFQKSEITEHHIYGKLSELSKNKNNSQVLARIADEELGHYRIWKKYSGRELSPDKLKYLLYIFISAVFGVTFCLKLLESRESRAIEEYSLLSNQVPEAEEIIKDETTHEKELISFIDEERLRYMGSVVLGLNDALVEFTGALAGFTLALQNSKIIAMAGLIMGLSASLSMAASEYLSTKTEGHGQKHPLKAGIYTGIAYVIAVVLLILPFMLFANHLLALMFTVLAAILMIFIFTFYSSTVAGHSFKVRFIEMFSISMGVAVLSFVIGLAARKLLNVDI